MDISNHYVKWDELICDLTSKEIPRLRCETYIDNKVTDGAVKRNQVARWDQQLPWKYTVICKDQATIGPILTTLVRYQPCCGTLWDVYWDEVDTSNRFIQREFMAKSVYDTRRYYVRRRTCQQGDRQVADLPTSLEHCLFNDDHAIYVSSNMSYPKYLI